MTDDAAHTAGLVEHFFRHEYGRLVAQLANKVGVPHVELVEDAVQGALATALTAWVAKGLPRDPSAWLYRVACNQLVGVLRKDAGRLRILASLPHLETAADATPSAHFADEVRDDLLRMLFVCCDDAIPRESRIVLALKTLCGFSTPEIALRLFTSEANVHKRLQRARETLRDATAEILPPPLDELRGRVPSVHEVLYLLFNEGYLSVHAESAIRRELCDEAVRLATLLAEHPVGDVPETFALLQANAPGEDHVVHVCLVPQSQREARGFHQVLRTAARMEARRRAARNDDARGAYRPVCGTWRARWRDGRLGSVRPGRGRRYGDQAGDEARCDRAEGAHARAGGGLRDRPRSGRCGSRALAKRRRP